MADPLQIGNGFAVIRTGSNVYRSVPIEDAERVAIETGATIVPVEEARAEAERQRYAGQALQAGAETVVRTATFGGVTGVDPTESEAERQRRAEVFQEEHPLAQGALQFGTEAAIDVGLTALTGGVGGAVARGSRMARVAGELVAGGVSAVGGEANQAFTEGREVEAWQAFAFGAGGTLAGRGAAHGLGKAIASARSSKEAAKALKAAASEETPAALREAQRRALDATLPGVYERAAQANLDDLTDVARVARHAQGIKSTAARDIARGLRQSDSVISEGTSIANKKAKVRVPDGNGVAQAEAILEASGEWQRGFRELEGAAGRGPAQVPTAAPRVQVDGRDYDLTLDGRTLDDLGAITDQKSFRRDSLEGLRADEGFARSGQASTGAGKGKGIRLELDSYPGEGTGQLSLRDGRHRLAIARERGLKSIYAEVTDHEGRTVFEGMIPLEAAPAPSGWRAGASALDDAVKGTDISAGMKRFQRDYQKSLDRVFAAENGQARFNALDDHKRLVMRAHKDVSALINATPGNALRYGEVRQGLEGLGENLRQLLEREDLWGEGALYQRAINKEFHASINAQSFVEGRFTARTGTDYFAKAQRAFDADKLRPFLDNVQEGSVTREEMTKYLRAQRAKLDILEKYEMVTPDQAKAARKSLDDVDAAFARSRVANEADVRFKAKQERARLAEREETGSGIGALAARAVASKLPGGGMLVGAWDMLQGIRSAASQLLLDAADSAAGRKAIATGGAALGRSAATAGIEGDRKEPEESSGIEDWGPFSEGYESGAAAYMARTDILREFTQNPASLVDALDQDIGWLARVNPKLHAQVAVRNSAAMRYLLTHLPPAVGVSMMRPKGRVPSRAAMRKFSRLWNAVMFPETVLQDIRDGRATVSQMHAIREVHPDLYQGLQMAVLDSVSMASEPLTTNRKVQLSTLFGLPGAAGLLYTPRVALLVAQSGETQQPQAGSGTLPGGEPSTVPAPAGIQALQGGVTMGAR